MNNLSVRGDLCANAQEDVFHEKIYSGSHLMVLFG